MGPPDISRPRDLKGKGRRFVASRGLADPARSLDVRLTGHRLGTFCEILMLIAGHTHALKNTAEHRIEELEACWQQDHLMPTL